MVNSDDFNSETAKEINRGFGHLVEELRALFDEATTETETAGPRGAALIAHALRDVARELGNGGAATPMGALEAHALKIHEGLTSIADALREVAEAINDHPGASK